MEKSIRDNKTSKMLRIDDTYSEIFALESALLKGDKLRANVRCRIARETKNPELGRSGFKAYLRWFSIIV